MPILHDIAGSQGLQIVAVRLAANAVLTVTLAAPRDAKVNWEDGGLSWTVTPFTEDDSIAYDVKHSLMPDGYDEHWAWAPDPASPFDGPEEGKEARRLERIRFTNTGGNDIVVIVNSASKYSLDES